MKTRAIASQPSGRAGVREGYVFPLVLAAIVLITLVTAIASTQVRLGNARMADMIGRETTHRAFHSAEQTFLYLALTSPAGFEGLEVGAVRGPGGDLSLPSLEPERASLVPANGVPVLFGDAPVVLRYLDQQAFLNLTGTEPVYLEARFDVLGIDRSLHRTVYAQLGDFQDEDDLTRVGARNQMRTRKRVCRPTASSRRRWRRACRLSSPGWRSAPMRAACCCSQSRGFLPS